VQDPTASLETLLKALPDKATPRGVYVKGDRVVVIAGDLNTLEGVVEDVRQEEGKLLVRPDMMKDQVVELELAEVQKLFKVGGVCVFGGGGGRGQ
jgi:transcription antitermination factor NusG